MRRLRRKKEERIEKEERNKKEVKTEEECLLRNKEGLLRNKEGLLRNKEGLLSKEGLLRSKEGLLRNMNRNDLRCSASYGLRSIQREVLIVSNKVFEMQLTMLRGILKYRAQASHGPVGCSG